jgi:hypothetical protein
LQIIRAASGTVLPYHRTYRILCTYRISIMFSIHFHIRAAFGRCCHIVWTVASSAAPNYHNKDLLRTVLPCRPNGCNSSTRLALLRIASGRCFPNVGQMQLSAHTRVCEGNLISCRTIICVRTYCHEVQTDATLNCLNILDTDGIRIHDWAVQTEPWDSTSLCWNLPKLFFEHHEPLF